jgi:hypothetical protein
MAYIVNTYDGVESYLQNLPNISKSARQRVIDAYLHDLAERADDLLARAPLAHESYMFQYEYLLLDGEYCYSFRFIADGSSMPFGVVQVIYVDCEIRPVNR